jgi:patatin-like phospholipase
MTHQARSALVLQGGGALGAYELGAARALYEDGHFNPDIIAGVSIGAITAVLLARPARGLKPLEALEAFWEKVTVPGMMLLPALRQYASLFGNRNFLVPRLDYLATCLGCSVVRKFNGAGLNAPPVEIRLGERKMTPNQTKSRIKFEAPAIIRKWPSLWGERQTEGRRPYLLIEGSPDECVRILVAKPTLVRHLYEIHTSPAAPFGQSRFVGRARPRTGAAAGSLIR